MSPQLLPELAPPESYRLFLSELQKLNFTGEISTAYAQRLAVAVDNSIYQIIPQAVVFPRDTSDIAMLFKLASQEKFHAIQFCPRGGGTSTNGQSLTSGIIIDCAKYMCEILELNLAEAWVRVQPGVVLDQLNTFLRPYDVKFAPEISPSNRATIGGMVNTDACGIGSRLYGRTSDHVLDLTCILPSGDIFNSCDNSIGHTKHAEISNSIEPYLSVITKKFTSAPRTLNGYNLKKAYEQKLNLNYLLCGSEGTLAMVGECKLKLTPLAKFKKLIVIKYPSFNAALLGMDLFEHAQPSAVEAIDEKLLDLARKDEIYFFIKNFIESEDEITRAINLVEFIADTSDALDKTIALFCEKINTTPASRNKAIGYYIAKNQMEEAILWQLRKKAVGLISQKTSGTRRPIPFIEDTAVPPAKLADYIAEFKQILDEHNLQYGMYGHVDAGCVHVRPALDMTTDQDKNLLRVISNKIVVLLEKYDGILWGEHGQGIRSQYAEHFFGPVLYGVVKQIKTIFDPYNQLNPGKIAIPDTNKAALLKIDEALRGDFDRNISSAMQAIFPSAMACNGNGACFNYETTDVMCPSYKVTSDRVHSPKGRATLLREWLRQLSLKKYDLTKKPVWTIFQKLKNKIASKTDFSHEVYAAMAGCLSCKACTSQCPLRVNVPELKSQFLQYYYQRYFRPYRDYLVASMEKMAPIQAKFYRFYNALMRTDFVLHFLKNTLKIVDPPLITPIRKKLITHFSIDKIQQLSVKEKARSVILLQDAFTSYYDSDTLHATYDFLTKIGFSVYITPFFVSGKPQQVKGFLSSFTNIVKKNTLYFEKLSSLAIPILGIEPSVTLLYRDEYKKITGKTFAIFLLQEWLITQKNILSNLKIKLDIDTYYLLMHCTEKTFCIEAEAQWQMIFSALNLKLKPLAAGCCGMAGSYGHEAEHLAYSKRLFAMDWQRYNNQFPSKIVATGYSCRAQTARLGLVRASHPIEILNQTLI